MSGTVVALCVAPKAGAPIEPRERVTLVAGRGIEGDRYAKGAGTWDGYPDQEVTLVEAEAADELGVSALDLRRNVVTRGVPLLGLVGKRFRIGEALLEGRRACDPCRYLEGKLARPGLKAALRGGLRAAIVAPGVVRVGDAVTLL